MLNAQNAPIPVGIHFKGTGPLSYNIETETLDLEDKMKLMTGRWLLTLGMNWAKISGKLYTFIVKIFKEKRTKHMGEVYASQKSFINSFC